ncbi:oxidoreductase [Lasiosphaeria miniovina]|uniref:Oxidoreductase n=1 Tax=Lasiosphaeria miniovina TaxID=1954250 RepID=A0AA40AL56_9PEZI|nr:oxidoreductase [Lasiosphaeria miniovina]KAK0717863.1 oxidoreductase [Lasiosphaeria miniovina]
MAPKTVLITGASEGGIGNALALAFQQRGLRVFATARSLSKMDNLSKLPNIVLLELDVTSRQGIEAAAAAVKSHTGEEKLDILVNNSGQSYVGPALDTSIEKVRGLFDVNFFGLVETTLVLGMMVVAAKGTIVNISSVLGHTHMPWLAYYNASKAAVDLFGETLRLEMAPFGVKVLTVAVGGVETNMSNTANVAPPELSEGSLWAVTEKYLAKRAAKEHRWATPPAVFAERVVRDVLNGTNGRVYRGVGATAVWIVTTLLPGWLKDKLVANNEVANNKFDIVRKP